jgi:hypothetical protein
VRPTISVTVTVLWADVAVGATTWRTVARARATARRTSLHLTTTEAPQNRVVRINEV